MNHIVAAAVFVVLCVLCEGGHGHGHGHDPVTFQPLPTQWSAGGVYGTAPAGVSVFHSASVFRIRIGPRGGVPSDHAYPAEGIEVNLHPTWTVRHLDTYVKSITGFQNVVLMLSGPRCHHQYGDLYLWNLNEPLYSAFSRVRAADGVFPVQYFSVEQP